MRKIFLLTLVLTVFFSGNAFALPIAGLWHVSGNGFIEKSVVRISLTITGNATLQTKVIDNEECLTSYDASLKIKAFSRTGLDITVRDEHLTEAFDTPLPIPDIEPTIENPIKFPAITLNGLTYEATITSINSGTLRITGYVDVDTIGTSEINTNCVIWRDGTPKPTEDTSSSSGCNFGLGIFALIMLFSGVKIIVRN